MMVVGLVDIDGHNYPNLALMKISAWHKSMGDTVSKKVNVDTIHRFDKVYMSKIFTFTEDKGKNFHSFKNIVIGGTGYNYEKLTEEVDKICPDYSLYPEFVQAYGFLTRGCPNKCSWCIVPEKEGKIRPYMDVEEFLDGRKEVVLMDNNVLASDFGLMQIEKCIKLNLKVDFNQGLDARIIANDLEIVKLLAKVRWKPCVRLACDSQNTKVYLRRAVTLLRKYGCTPKQYFVYVLLTEFEDSYNRINFCKELKLDAFAQPFRDFTQEQNIPQWQKDMARYTNRKQLYRTMDFKDYKPRKGFICREYFKS